MSTFLVQFEGDPLYIEAEDMRAALELWRAERRDNLGLRVDEDLDFPESVALVSDEDVVRDPPNHPLTRQPLVADKDGTLRFAANPIVVFLLDEATAGRKCNMTDLVGFAELHRGATPADQCQFAQLIGYSLDGYADLHYVSSAEWAEAAKGAPPA